MVYISLITLSSGTISMAIDAFNTKDATKAITDLFPENKGITITPLKKFLENGISVDSKGKATGNSIITKAQHELNR